MTDKKIIDELTAVMGSPAPTDVRTVPRDLLVEARDRIAELEEVISRPPKKRMKGTRTWARKLSDAEKILALKQIVSDLMLENAELRTLVKEMTNEHR